jgi:PAS domain S-box-containing protein
MATRRNVLVAVIALVALVVLGMQSQVRDTQDDNRMLDGARRLRELDAIVDRSVLEARDVIQSYDGVSGTVQEIDGVALEIEATSARIDDPDVAQHVARAREALRRQADLVEDFTSRNALVRNSLAYLPRAARRAATFRGTGEDETTVRAVANLLAAVSWCRTNCDAAALEAIQLAISDLAASRQRSTPLGRAAIDPVLHHARLLAVHLPQRQRLIDEVLASDGQEYDHLYAAVRSHHMRAVAMANRLRLALVVVSVVLLGAVAVMFRRVRQKQSELANLNEHLEVRVAERTQDLVASREQYRVLLESTQAIPWEMEPDSLRFSYVGPQAARVLGYPTEAWLEEGFLARRLHPDDLAGSLATLRAVNDHEIELRMVAADGRCLWLRSFVSTARDANGRPVRRGILLDVTARRTLEAKLNISQKLESVGRLASGIAHEINTPVQFVTDNVHFVSSAFVKLARLLDVHRRLMADASTSVDERLAAAHAADEAADIAYLVEEAPRALEGSVEGLGRIATIVRSLAEFSHPDSRDKREADLNASLRSTLTVARNEYKDVAELHLDLGELPPVLCHVGEINQVILNLTVNAAHAIADQNPDGALGRITVRSRHEGPDVVISISDTGGGIPEHVRGVLFDPFFTTKEVGRGTGQGLAIARTIVVEKHGGDLTFETEVGHGTTFTLRFPVDAEAPRLRAG